MAPIKKPKPVLGSTFLRAWREFAGVTQEEAAAAINVSRGILSKMENSVSPYLQQHIEGLAELYKCRPADLLGTDPMQKAAPNSPEAALRAALIAFGVDACEVGRAVSSVKVFVDDHDEQSSQDLPDDQREPSIPRR